MAENFASKVVFGNEDIIPLWLAKMPVGHAGFRALLNLQATQKKFIPYITTTLARIDWIFYQAGFRVVQQYANTQMNFQNQMWDWPKVIDHLEQYSVIEDVVEDIMVNLWTRIPPVIRLDANNSYEILFVELATPENMDALTSLMEKYPSNAQILSVGCAMLLKMYDNDTSSDTVSGMKHLRWAIKASSVPTPSFEQLHTNIRLMTHLGDMWTHLLWESDDILDCDLISFVFDIEHKFHMNPAIMLVCNELLNRELYYWTMPVPEARPGKPAPVDIITNYMEKYPHHNEYQIWGCGQLSDLANRNQSSIVISQLCMSRICNHVRTHHARILLKPTDPFIDDDSLYKQQEDMWTFLNAVVPSSDAAYVHFMDEGGLVLLLKSLGNVLVLRDVDRGIVQVSFEKEIRELCLLLSYVCRQNDANIDTFLSHDGLGVVVHALNYFLWDNKTPHTQCHQPTTCLKLLRDIFCRTKSQAVAYITDTRRGATQHMKRFPFRYRHFTTKMQTFPFYLVSALGRYEIIPACKIDEYTVMDVSIIIEILKFLVLQPDSFDVLTPEELQFLLVSFTGILKKVDSSDWLTCVCNCDDIIKTVVHQTHDRNTLGLLKLYSKQYHQVSMKFRT